MQTTLLGLALALILALLAALIGPFVIDWNQFRDQFEAEATRLAGAPVRVAGPLDARLLPTPTLRLRDVTVGGANDPGRISAAKLDVEFSLGSLMRGEWRADELSVNGVSLDLGLDANGRLDWPAYGLSNLAALTIDRLNLTGRIALHDAASRSTIELNDIAFAGDLRAQASALRGDGNFAFRGNRYPFRLSAGRATDGTGTRLRFSAEQAGAGLATDLEGVVTFEGQSPRFDGTAALAATAATEPPRTPWRISAKVKADPAMLVLDQLETSWGPEERAVKLVGSGNVRLGASPLLTVKMTGRQLDGDRLLAAEAGDPWLPRLRELAGDLPRPPLPMKIAFDAEQVMLGSRPLTDITAELRGDGEAWRIERLDLRAPGGSRFAMSGAAAAGAGDPFKGTVTLDSADPDLLSAWLQGRPPTAGSTPKPLRVQGSVAAAPGSLSVDPLKIEADGNTLQGRVAYRATPAEPGGRIEATLTGDGIEFDSASGLVSSLAGPRDGWPAQASLALDVREARSRASGQIWRPLIVKFGYGPGTMTLDQLHAGSASGLALEGDGALDRASATGRLNLKASAPSLAPIVEALEPIAPAVAARLKAMGDAPGATQTSLALSLDHDNAKAGQVKASGVVQIDSPLLRGRALLTAAPKIADVGELDAAALGRIDFGAETRLTATRGAALLGLLGLDRSFAAGEGAATLDATANGTWQGALKLKARLAGGAFDVEADGNAEPWAAEPKAALSLNARRLDLAPLLELTGTEAGAARISATSRLAVSGRQWTFNEIDAALGDSRLRGRLALTLGDDVNVDGEVGLDTLALAPTLQLALGVTGRDPAEPLGSGLLRGWRGKISFQSVRAILPGGSELQPLGGTLRHDGRMLTLDANGKLGGGDAKVLMHARPGDVGVSLDATVNVNGANASALRFGNQTMPAAKASLQMTLDSIGRSPSALSGALAGGGTLTLERAKIPGLDLKAFEVAMRAGESAQPVDDASLAKMIEPVLAAGPLMVDGVQMPISLADGRLRVSPTTLQAKGARAVISGGYDIPAGQADIRATLTMTGTGPGLPPEIRIFAAGPPERLTRNVDLSALSSWLTVKRIERETRKLQTLEQEARPPVLPAARPDPQISAPLSPSRATTDGPPAPGVQGYAGQDVTRPDQNKTDQDKQDQGKPTQDNARRGDASPDQAKQDTRPAGQNAARPGSVDPKPVAPGSADPGSAGPGSSGPASQGAAVPQQPGQTPRPAETTAPQLVPLPDADPRRAPVPQPKSRAASPSPTPKPAPAPPQASNDAASHPRELSGSHDRVQPLPPPLEIKPAPGDARATSRPRQPLILTPPNNSRTAY
ncbi:AsmA family protein [Rhodopseudomonas sp. HC1]|uniref:AsmA family protein n=1 Tax=Rhodopseudomonas infernalis TaxID=2897386 RepID=UPI001EE88319|nr:AsmA family protein [Rhodopseudomonas infernalis]MCG6206853.1 AsmA family protein [Rhodopseudomonas infernalis]